MAQTLGFQHHRLAVISKHPGSSGEKVAAAQQCGQRGPPAGPHRSSGRAAPAAPAQPVHLCLGPTRSLWTLTRSSTKGMDTAAQARRRGALAARRQGRGATRAAPDSDPRLLEAVHAAVGALRSAAAMFRYEWLHLGQAYDLGGCRIDTGGFFGRFEAAANAFGEVLVHQLCNGAAAMSQSVRRLRHCRTALAAPWPPS